MNDQKLFSVDKTVAVITGAGTGLGRMMAHALASNGAEKVYILGRREDKLKETAKGYNNIIPIQADATDKASLKSAADRIKSEVGYINVLIANSGVLGPSASIPQSGSIGDLQEHFWSYPENEMNRVFEVNNTGTFFTLVAFLELLHLGNETQNTPGIQSSVIFTASIAGFARVLTTDIAYLQSKAGALQATKTFSTLLAKWNIRVNAIAPGIYPSECDVKPQAST